MVYRIEFLKRAEKHFKSLPSDAQKRLSKRIDALAQNPRPSGVKKLSNNEEKFYRIRESDYRVIYQIHDQLLLVFIVDVGHRRKIYKELIS